VTAHTTKQVSAERVRLTMYAEHRYERADLCGPCGGNCCKSAPGTTHPAQWGSTREEMIARLTVAFRTGKWAIDWWEGDPLIPDWEDENALGRVDFVRPAVLGKSDLRDPSWGGRCTFLRATGCELPHDERPVECQQLEPAPDGKDCRGHGQGKEANAIAWREFQDVIAAAERAVTGSH
jgi:hypothetical protein